MAREYARIRCDVWTDPDFGKLTVLEQHVYWLLLSSKGLSRCGVLSFIPGRFVGAAADLTEPKLIKAVNGLTEAGFCGLDKRTMELCIRSYVRYDGVLDRANMGKAVGTAYEAILSTKLAEMVGRELARYYRENPSLPGWDGLAATSPSAYYMATEWLWEEGK